MGSDTEMLRAENQRLKERVRLLTESNSQLQESVRTANNRMATAVDARDYCEQERERLMSALEDFRDHGLRFDLNPTVADVPQDRNEAVTFLLEQQSNYLKRADEQVRNRALRALHPRKRVDKWKS